MVAVINFRNNIKAFQAKMSETARKQVPFATAQALTQLAREVMPALKQAERTELDRPTPFTQNALRVLPARKDALTARVVVTDKIARYLSPYEFGGVNALNSSVLLKPIAEVSNLDQFGNIPRYRMDRLRARSDVFVGIVKTKAGPIYGVWQRPTNVDGAGRAALVPTAPVKLNKKTGRLEKVAGAKLRRTRKGGQSTGRLKLLIKFTPAHPIRQNLKWFDTAEGIVTKRFNKVFGAALAKAIGSPK